jgi:hypothetical protein|tara:strand:- start:317 stop:526 length:210 start_codon:yes stop_codon:yes gene_type:complete
MNKNYQVKEILSAIETLLSGDKKVVLSKNADSEKPLVLKKEIKSSKRKIDDVPQNTEDIIIQAEKYLKR